MSTDYTETLKKIKEAEEATSRELLDKRKGLEEQLREMEDASAASIAEAKKQADALIASEVEEARETAEKQADALLASSAREAKETTSKSLDKVALRKIIDNTILSEFK